MRLPPTGLAIALALAGGLAALPGTRALAEATGPARSGPAAGPAAGPIAGLPARLFVIGAGPDEEARRAGLPQVVMDGLPPAGDAEAAVISAILHAGGVASVASTPGAAAGDAGGAAAGDAGGEGRAGMLFLRVEALAGPDEGGAAGGGAESGAAGGGILLAIGGTVMDLPEFGRRLAALAGALAPGARPLLYLRIADPGDLLADRAAELQRAAAGAGFALVVAATGEGAACRPALAPDLALAAGLADRVPFGNGDGETSMAEARAWLEAALARPARRRPGCAAAHVLVVHDGGQAARPVLGAPAAGLPQEFEEHLAREILEAHVLASSPDPGAIGAWLAQCLLCPGEAALAARAAALREEARTRAIEAGLWDGIAADTSPERIRAWLATCRICAQREAAESRLAALGAEGAALDAALAARDPAALRAWLDGCIRCERRDEAAAAAEELRLAETLVAPCVAAAGLPQAGGPRQLDDIDIPRARLLCGAALAELPRDIRLRVLSARIDQAEGRTDEAAMVYDDGVAEGLPEAHGLAAYLRLSPPGDVAPDPEAAAALAQAGAERGDWLSKEVLILLYSRGMVEGHDPAEAAALARGLAGEGDVVADFFLGYFLQNGIGTEADDAGAVEHLARALEGGYARAAPYLAQMVEAGRGTGADPARAAALLWSALEAGDGVALELLTARLDQRPREVIRLIQEKLREAGALDGAADGRAGPATRRAVAAHAEALSQQG